MFFLLAAGFLAILFLCLLTFYYVDRQQCMHYTKNMILSVGIKFSVEDQGAQADQQIIALISLAGSKPTVRSVMIKEMKFKDGLFLSKKIDGQFDLVKYAPLSVPLQLGRFTKQEIVARVIKVHLYGVYRHENGCLKSFQACVVCNIADEEFQSSLLS